MHRQIQLALRIIQFPLLLEQIGLNLLSFCEFDVVLFENLLKFGNGLRLAGSDRC